MKKQKRKNKLKFNIKIQCTLMDILCIMISVVAYLSSFIVFHYSMITEGMGILSYIGILIATFNIVIVGARVITIKEDNYI